MTSVYCTLFEGDYHFGVASLLNSLERNEIRATVVCGFRGPPPFWVDQTRKLKHVRAEFVPVVSERHFTNYKPVFMLESLVRHPSSRVYYIDPDVVVKTSAAMMARWATDGISLAEDVNGHLPARHPLRLAWSDFLADRQHEQLRDLDVYYNAGFVGVPAEMTDFLQAWVRILDELELELGPLSTLANNKAGTLFRTPDQDAMNMTLSLGLWPVNGAGPEAMDFASGGQLLSHAIGSAKPWMGHAVANGLKGRVLAPAHKNWLTYAEGPIRAMTRPQLARIARSQRLASAIGRVYRRA